jgi:hypothetical protein
MRLGKNTEKKARQVNCGCCGGHASSSSRSVRKFSISIVFVTGGGRLVWGPCLVETLCLVAGAETVIMQIIPTWTEVIIVRKFSE